jgi:surface antigen
MRALRRAVLAMVAAATLFTTVLTATPAHASATGYQEVCSGFVGCTLKGYPAHGYDSVLGLTHWGALSGHNCTNYVAYRLAYRDRVVARPYGSASAITWRAAAIKSGVPVSSTPRVGDVAWWDAGAPAGTSGHVAMVEQVFSDGSVLVSHDNVVDDFAYSRFTKGGTYYPDAFLRFPPSDGSPAGGITAITSPSARTINISGQASDPDRYESGIQLLVTVGGYRTSTAKRFTTRTGMPWSFGYHRTDSTLFRSGRTIRIYVYAVNTSGSRGSAYTFLTSKAVTIR